MKNRMFKKWRLVCFVKLIKLKTRGERKKTRWQGNDIHTQHWLFSVKLRLRLLTPQPPSPFPSPPPPLLSVNQRNWVKLENLIIGQDPTQAWMGLTPDRLVMRIFNSIHFITQLCNVTRSRPRPTFHSSSLNCQIYTNLPLHLSEDSVTEYAI